MSDTVATWDISLTTNCPKCEHEYDLMDEYWDLWDGIQAGETGTVKTTGVETTCPNCKHNFTVDYEY
jgi:transposase-like protein